MWVKYIGHGDMVSADWNGKRYIFSKRRKVQEIPDGLYDFIKSSNFVLKHDVIYTEPPKQDMQIQSKRGRPKGIKND